MERGGKASETSHRFESNIFALLLNRVPSVDAVGKLGAGDVTAGLSVELAVEARSSASAVSAGLTAELRIPALVPLAVTSIRWRPGLAPSNQVSRSLCARTRDFSFTTRWLAGCC